ncbi:hypothetical protein FB451DRAFT_362869 [Mycena latifolia]|nr:hypothetical protein FB451DRAFT_362869 [Mycena latifolia]
MRPTALFSMLLLSALSASALPGRRQSVQCAPADDDGVPLSGSAPSGDFVSCEYDGGAGECTYFPADGSFSSGSSQCPPGVAQDPSATTDAPSTDDGATSTAPDSAPSSTDDSTPSSTDDVSSTDDATSTTPEASSAPASTSASTPASTPAASTKPASKTTTPTQTGASTSPSASPSNGASARTAPGAVLGLAGLALGLML